MTRRTKASEAAGRDLRDAILDATRGLLDERRFDEISVADVLGAAGVSRGSFYFYFESKHDVLAELVRRAVGRGHEMAEAWRGHTEAEQHLPTVRQGISGGARLWREQAPVLRAIVENWRSDPKLTALWLEQMESYTATTAARIDEDRGTGAVTHDAVDSRTLATALTWLGERLYYLAAIDVAPFDDQDALVDVLTHIWMSALYATPPETGPGGS